MRLKTFRKKVLTFLFAHRPILQLSTSKLMGFPSHEDIYDK